MAKGNNTEFVLINGGDQYVSNILSDKPCPYCGHDKVKISTNMSKSKYLIYCEYDLCEMILPVIITLEEFKK